MCLYPRLMLNRKYMPTKKNGYNAPELKNPELKYVAVACGNCIECRKQKSREWQTRLTEELKTQKYAYFVTFSFSPKSLTELTQNYNLTKCNETAGKAIRLFLERYRKKYKKSCKHWLVTELGQTNTERIHLHGILLPEQKINKEEWEKIWQYGNVYIGEYCSLRTVNYIVKYITKIDEKHKDFKSTIFCSKGLGKNYLNEFNKQKHKYKPNNTVEYYSLPNGAKINLPIYYRNKLFTEEEREKLWLSKVRQHTIFIRGKEVNKIDTPLGEKKLNTIRNIAREINNELGYGTDEWKLRDYLVTFRSLNAHSKDT